MGHRSVNPPAVLLVAAIAASSALLLTMGAQMTFFQDSWAFLLERPGNSAADFLRPHNEHISVIPVAIQKATLPLFGMESDFHERVLLTALLAATALLFFVYMRRRVGGWPALFASVILLFLGPAWEVILWPFEISLVGSVLFGLATLLALDRDDTRGDLAACLFLLLAIGFSSLGIPFVAAAGVNLLQRSRMRGWGRAYVVAVPAIAFAAWYFTYGQDAESSVHLDIASATIFVAKGIAASVASILGLRTLAGGIEEQYRADLGLLALGAALIVGAYMLGRQPDGGRRLLRDPAGGLWQTLGATGAFWGLAALNEVSGRTPYASRYMHVGVILAFLVAANLLAGVSFRRRALTVMGAVTAVAVALNLVSLWEGRNRLVHETVIARSDFAAIEIARKTVHPEFRLGPEFAGTPSLINVSAAPYLDKVEEYGSPAYTESELAEAPEVGRQQADVVLAHALPLTVETVNGGAPAVHGACKAVPAAGSRAIELSPGTTAVKVPPGPPASLSLRRFSRDGFPVVTDPAVGGSTTLLTIPRDTSERPWWLLVEGTRPIRVCSERGRPKP